MNIKEMPTQQLKLLAQALNHSINVIESYGHNDVMQWIAVEEEIERREESEVELAGQLNGAWHP